MKKGDARRSELLATAERLFCTKGYEKTTIQDILDALNYSKGGFYHHFDSKLALLDAICARRAQQSFEAVEALLKDGEGGAVEHLNALLHEGAFLGGGSPGFAAMLIQAAYRPDGALMREKMKQMQLESLLPLMEAILEEGMRSRAFYVSEPAATAEMILRLYMQLTDEIAFQLASCQSEAQAMETIVLKLRVYRSAIERTLAAPFGSVVLFEAEQLQSLAQEVLRRRNQDA